MDMAKNGSERVALKEIAAEASVSIATVSMALSNHPSVSEETKQRIRKLSSKMGYRPRQRRKHNTVSQTPAKRLGFVVLMGGRDEESGYEGSLQAAARTAPELGVRMETVAFEIPGDHASVVNNIMNYAMENINGLLISGFVNPEILKDLQWAGMPAVVLGYICGELGESLPQATQVVSSDNTSASFRLTAHMIKQGHEKVGFVCERIVSGLSHHRCLIGYKLAQVEHGRNPSDALVHVSGKPKIGGGPAAEFFSKQKSPPSAYICPDARIASSFLSAMRSAGHSLKASDIGVFDSATRIEHFMMQESPSVLINHEAEVRCAMERLLQLIDHPALVASETLVPCEGLE